MTMLKTALTLLLLMLSVVSTAYARQQEPDDEEVVRVSTSVVTVPVSVSDRQGRFIPDLRKEDFRIYEDGVEQEVAFFETADKPFTVVLLLDASDSTRLKFAEIQEAALAFLEQLRPADKVAVAVFNRDVYPMTGAAGDRAVAASAIRRSRSGRGTAVYDAFAAAAGRWLSGHGGRKAVVIFTDGVDTASRRASYESTLNAAEELDALVYTIQYKTEEDVAAAHSNGPQAAVGQLGTPKGEPLYVAYKRAGLYLRLLADKTGGRTFQAGSQKMLAESFARIAEELRQQYSLGYYPKDRSEKRKKRRLKVRVGLPDVAVRARSAYAYGAQTGDTEK